MKYLIALLLVTMSSFTMAYGYGDKQSQEANAAAISAAAASNKTVVEVDNHNHNNAQGGKAVSVSQGGKATSGSLSNSGGNKIGNAITIDGDISAASSAITGMASECVTVLAAQATGGCFSIGGIDGDCRAAIASDHNLKLYSMFQNSDPEAAADYLALAKKYAALANPSAFKIYMSGTRQVVTDIALSIGWLALFAL